MALPTHVLSVEARGGKGSGAVRKLRAKDIVPGVFYTKEENIMVQVPQMPLWKTYTKAGMNQVFQLEIDKDGKKSKTPTMIKSIQFYPTKTKIMHVDFIGIDMNKKLRVHVPVEVLGEAKGVKDGGILEVYRDFMEVECLPGNIPGQIDIDVTNLGLNETVHVRDVALPEGVEAVNFEENYAILGISFASEVSAEGEEGGEGEGGEASEAAEESGAAE